MSAFCVFGMTELLAKELAKKSPPPPSQRKEMSPEDIENWRHQRAETLLKQAKARQVSNTFSAPQFCRDWIKLANKTTRATRLKIMARTVKKDNKGNPVISKRTKLPLMEWTPYE